MWWWPTIKVIHRNFFFFLKEYEDHGDYWRGDYETIDGPVYSYSRDQVMEDARRVYMEVGQKKPKQDFLWF